MEPMLLVSMLAVPVIALMEFVVLVAAVVEEEFVEQVSKLMERDLIVVDEEQMIYSYKLSLNLDAMIKHHHYHPNISLMMLSMMIMVDCIAYLQAWFAE